MVPAQQSAPRPSDDDRARVVDRLRDAAGDGVITLEELEGRLAAAYAAGTLPELAPLTADLPDVAPPRVDPPIVPDDVAFRMHLTVYGLVIGMLVVIWAASGGGLPFWPLFPAAGWGVGLGAHWQVARLAAERRSRRSQREGREAERHAFGASAPGIPAIAAGAPASAVPRPRYVVAMFVDVVGSTSLNEALGDEQWVAVRRALRDQLAACAEAHGGWEANTAGDGVLLRFDDPISAATAATELLRRLERQRTETGFAPSVRVGIHSGDAMEDGDDIIGNVVNLAARVTDAADADEILVTEHVADHLDNRHTTDGRGLHTLKGISRPRHLLTLVWR
jgi:class 3 adenylate cyclase